MRKLIQETVVLHRVCHMCHTRIFAPAAYNAFGVFSNSQNARNFWCGRTFRRRRRRRVEVSVA